MENVAIVTDSVACLPKDIAEQYGIFVAPFNVIIGDHIYQDGIDITPSEVYELQRTKNILPTTSAATPGDILNIYLTASKKAHSILHISITPGLTMAFEAALQAKEMAKEIIPNFPIEVLDSRTAAGSQGFLSVAAAKIAASGGNLFEAKNIVERLIPKMRLYVTVDTLYFLAKGGRVPRIAAWASSILSIKPILEVGNGQASPVSRVRTKPKAIHQMIELMRSDAVREPVHVNVMHAGVPQEADSLCNQIKNEFDCIELYKTEFTPVMGVHTGPGLIGFAYYVDTLTC